MLAPFNQANARECLHTAQIVIYPVFQASCRLVDFRAGTSGRREMPRSRTLRRSDKDRPESLFDHVVLLAFIGVAMAIVFSGFCAKSAEASLLASFW